MVTSCCLSLILNGKIKFQYNIVYFINSAFGNWLLLSIVMKLVNHDLPIKFWCCEMCEFCRHRDDEILFQLSDVVANKSQDCKPSLVARSKWHRIQVVSQTDSAPSRAQGRRYKEPSMYNIHKVFIQCITLLPVA